MLSTAISYRLIARDLPRSLAQKAQERPVALETAYFQKNIASVRSIDDFLKNTRLFKFAMTAFGLEDMANAKGFMRKILTEGVDDPKSLANRLTDSRFKAFATVFDFAGNGANTTDSVLVQNGVVNRYIQQNLETSAGEENEGVRLALYFKRTAPSVTSAYGILGDVALWKVVKTIFSFPDEMANADIGKQAAAVTKRLDIASLADPAKLDKLITRFTAVWDAQNAASSPLLSLFGPGSSSSGMGLDLAMTLHNLKHGGR